MAVEVKDLRKRYGTQWALGGISFKAEKGRITGFLGPNGAGKSTTMKIATGFLQPHDGTVLVDGIDVLEEPIKARQHIGYLPENNPLYLDMYVREYLQYAGSLFKMEKNIRSGRISEMITLTGLGPEIGKKIGALSKGFRQRVGLAQALLHDPPVLFLDEPTSGLDPNQILEIRNLIKNLGKEKTVILSTHIMQEVQAICDDVVIIHKGEIVANDTVQNLTASQKGTRGIRVEFVEPVRFSDLEKIEGIQKAEVLGEREYRISVKEGVEPGELLMREASKNAWGIVEMKKESQSLEDVFHELTQD